MYKPEKVLMLAAHPDDETNCAGTLHKFCREGVKVDLVVFSDCQQDSEENDLDPAHLIAENINSAQIIGINLENVKWFIDHKVRYFQETRQDICDQMFDLNKRLKPDLVIVPNTTDLHQDHCVIRDEARRAFRQCSIFGYESIRAPLGSGNLCFLELSYDDYAAKEKALRSYTTQGHRLDIEARMGLCRIRGSQIGCEYAEAFEVIRMRG